MTTEEWLKFSEVIASIVIVIVALIPIFKEWFHGFRYKRVLREQILIELRDINESYSGKMIWFSENPCQQSVIVPEHDKDFFKRLTISFEHSAYLSGTEQTKIGLLLRSFRTGIYNKDKDDRNIINIEDTKKIVGLSEELSKIIGDKISIKFSTMKKIIIPVIVIALIIIAIVVFKKESWQGFYYPNGCLTCQSDYIYSPVFNDRTSCLSWASNLKQQRNSPSDTFECGKNCKAPENKNGAYICKETVDY